MTARKILPGNERIVSDLVARLVADLNDTITAVNALADATVQLDSVPTAQILDYTPTSGQLLAFPTVAVQEAEGHLEDDTGWGATGVHGLVVTIYDCHVDQQTLARRLRRYRRAVASVIADGRKWGSSSDSAWIVTDIRYRPGPTLGRGDPDNTREWMSYTHVGFLVKIEEYTP